MVVLKRPRSPFQKAVFRLHGLLPEQIYQVTDWDSQETSVATGEELMEQGRVMELPGNPDSALIRYQVK